MNVEEQLEHQPPAKKSRMNDPSQEEPAEIAIQNDGATRNKQIRELEISTMDKKEELKELKMEMIALKKLSSLKEKCQKKFAKLEAKLEMKNQKLTEEFEEKIKKLEERIQMNEQKIDEMVPIHEMKVQLPPENWHDILAFVPRSQLGNAVSQIGNRQFADIIQSFLHDEVREITLGRMEIIAPRPNVSSDQPMVKVGRNAATNMPDWPMPGNIKNFQGIGLNYVDMSVLHLLEKFQENSLLTDVNLCFCNSTESLESLDEDILLQVLAKITPFITSIDSIAFPEIDLFELVYNAEQEDNRLLKEMMAKTRILMTDWNPDREITYHIKCSWEHRMDLCFSWLYTPRKDGKPRMLISHYSIYEPTAFGSFINRIKKDFDMANNPVSFFIYINRRGGNFEDISIDNVKNEKLVIKTESAEQIWMRQHVRISRYPLNAAKSWVEANEKKTFESGLDHVILDRKIYMDGELTIAM